jgi:hypothetical protein
LKHKKGTQRNAAKLRIMGIIMGKKPHAKNETQDPERKLLHFCLQLHGVMEAAVL